MMLFGLPGRTDGGVTVTMIGGFTATTILVEQLVQVQLE
jgi:hypothetical protein